MLDVARAHPQVLPEPAPVPLFLRVGDSASRLDLWVQTQSELAVALFPLAPA